MVALLLCAIVSQTGVDIRRAPELPPWPTDIPAPLLTPAPGCADVGAGVFLQDRLAGVVEGRLEALSSYPLRCQARLDALGRVHDVTLRGAVEAAWIDAEKHAEAGAWRWWEVALVGLGAAAAGVVSGVVLGLVAAQ